MTDTTAVPVVGFVYYIGEVRRFGLDGLGRALGWSHRHDETCPWTSPLDIWAVRDGIDVAGHWRFHGYGDAPVQPGEDGWPRDDIPHFGGWWWRVSPDDPFGYYVVQVSGRRQTGVLRFHSIGGPVSNVEDDGLWVKPVAPPCGDGGRHRHEPDALLRILAVHAGGAR